MQEKEIKNEYEEMLKTLISLAPDLKKKEWTKRTPRDGEIANLRVAVEVTLETGIFPDFDEIDELRTRIKGLVQNPASAGKHGEM